MEKEDFSSIHDHGTREDTALEKAVSLDHQQKGTVILITSDAIGSGEHDHARQLLKDFIYTLTESAPLPGKIILVNTAIFLAVEGSEVREPLHLLHEQGVEILISEQCIEYHKLLDKLVDGTVTGLYTITETLLSAQKVITL